MRTPPPDQVNASLEPVRAELLRAARADATAILDQAKREAAATLRKARAEAELILARARQQGEAEGASAASAARVAARRAVRAHDLAIRREAYERVRREAVERVRQLRDSADYAQVLDRLGDHARRLLGPQAEIAEHRSGGIVARAPGRYLDLSLDAYASRALDQLGAELESLWTS